MFKFVRPIRSTPIRTPFVRALNTVKYPREAVFTSKPPKSQKSHFKRYFVFFLAGALVSYNFSVHELVQIWHRPLPQTAKEAQEFEKRLETELQELPVVQQLSHNDKLVVTRSWESFDAISKVPLQGQAAPHTITDSLASPGGISIRPLVFNDRENKKSYVVVHLGQRLSGYPLIVHGGILGMLVDEVFKKSCGAEFGVLDVNRLHTEQSVLNYRSPTFVDRFVLFETECEKLGWRRYKVTGKVSDAKSGRRLVDADEVITQGRLPQSKEITTQEQLIKEQKGWFW